MLLLNDSAGGFKTCIVLTRNLHYKDQPFNLAWETSNNDWLVRQTGKHNGEYGGPLIPVCLSSLGCQRQCVGKTEGDWGRVAHTSTFWQRMRGFHLRGFASKFSLMKEHSHSLKFCAAFLLKYIHTYQLAAVAATFSLLQMLLLAPLGGSKQVAHMSVAGFNLLIGHTRALSVLSNRMELGRLR